MCARRICVSTFDGAGTATCFRNSVHPRSTQAWDRRRRRNVAAVGSGDALRATGHTMWDDLRRQLGFDDLSYEPGTWWCVPHDAVTHHDHGPYPGEPFARKAAPGDGRPVVLGTAYGPNATLFARSASIPTTYEHPVHVHTGGSSRCRITAKGWINFRMPVSVSVEILGEEHFSCEEPPETTFWAALAAAVTP